MGKASAAKAGRKPGRPSGQQSTKDEILDAAETLFAENGYSATSIRDIALAVNVNQAMIGYYFGSKQALFETVFKRRGDELSKLRARGLDALRAAGKDKDVHALIGAFLRPQFDMKRLFPAWVRLQARVHSEPDTSAFKLRRDVYDEVARDYITALENALPDLDPADINWRMTFLVGAYLHLLAGLDRLHEISGGRFDSANVDETVDRLTSFLAGGMRTQSTYLQPGKAAKAGRPRVRNLA